MSESSRKSDNVGAQERGDRRGLRLPGVVSRSGPIVILGMLLGLAAGAASLWGGDPVHVSEARMRIVDTGSAAPSAGQQQSDAGLVLSRDIARRAIRDLGVTLDDLDPRAGRSVPRRMLQALGLSRPPSDVPPEDRLLAAFLDRLSVKVDPASQEIAVRFHALDPVLAERAANRVVTLYTDMNAQAGVGASRGSAVLVSPAVAEAPSRTRGPRSVLAGFALFGLGLSAGLAGLKEWRFGSRSRRASAPAIEPPHVPGEVRIMTRVSRAVNEDRRADLAERGDAPDVARQDGSSRSGEKISEATKPDDAASEAADPSTADQAETIALRNEPEGQIDAFVEMISSAGRAAYAQRILVTHIEAEVDCAMTALQVARALSPCGRTILVGLGAKDRADSASEGRPAIGLSELIDGAASFSAAIHRDKGTRLHILPAGRGSLSDDVDLDPVLDALSQTYDFVVLSATVDGEEGRDRALDLAPEADYVLLACSGQFGDPEIAELRDELVEAGAGDVLALRAVLLPEGARAAA